MSHHSVEMSGISYNYPDGHAAVKDVSFSIHHGESVGLIGSNGAGKSTLLMLLMGVIFPKGGEIRVNGIPVTKQTLPLTRRSAGMVFQNTDDQLFMSSVEEDVAFGPRNMMLDEKEVRARTDMALEAAGIVHLRDRPTFKLSEGEKRCAAIASVLSMHPDILVMDEPTSFLDPRGRRRLITMLNGFDHTKIITSHDLEMIRETCRRVIVIKEGTVAADGAADEILSDAALMARCGLEVPASLMKCPACGADLSEEKSCAPVSHHHG